MWLFVCFQVMYVLLKLIIGNAIGFYFDENNEVAKYKLETKSERIKHQLLPNWIRKDEYIYMIL